MTTKNGNACGRGAGVTDRQNKPCETDRVGRAPLMATVLIADDSRVHVQLLTGWLQDLGLEVIPTFDAIQAWVTAMRTQPNMIILDINMPGGSGIDVLKRLKNSTKTRDIPVLVISGNAGPDIRDLVKRLGAVELLEKPLGCEALCDFVSRLVVSPPNK